MYNQIKELLEKIPFSIVLVLFLANLGWDFYGFMNDAESSLGQSEAKLVASRDEIGKLRHRVQATMEFSRTLELKKTELRKLAQELEDSKTILSDSLDTPSFMKAVVTEAQRSGLVVLGIKPLEAARKEYYGQQDFELRFRGVYAQLLGFMERVSSMQRIVRVDDFSIKPTSPATARYVLLEGDMKMKAFYYLGSKADELAKDGLDAKVDSAKSAASPVKGNP